MDAKIITGLLLCFCLMASISISQSASASLDSRLRFRRQNDESVTCPEGTKSCKDDNKKCVTYCNGNPECADGSDELDCATIASATISAVVSTGSIGNEIERADAPQATTDLAEATLPQISLFDLETLRPADAGTTADAVDGAGTTAASDVATVTAILADGTTIVLPPGTTATVVASDVTAGGATETLEPAATGIVVDGTTIGAATVEAVTGAEDATATGVLDNLETSTIIVVDNGTDVFTSIKPGNGHATEEEGASNDTVTTMDETTSAGVTVELATVDSNITTIFNNETATEVTDTLWTTTIEAGEVDENATQANGTEDATTPSPAQPGPGGRVELRVVVSPAVLQVQRGQTVEITCTVYGGDQSTNIFWIQDEPERRYALTNPAGENDRQVTASQVTLRSRITLDDPSKIGKYTCSAQDGAGNSGLAILTMQEGGYVPQPGGYPGSVAPAPSGGRGYLRIVAPDMADGDYVEIQCDGAAPEDESSIQWYFNNRLVNDEQPLFPRGKTLHIRPISRPYLGNYRCTVPGGSYTDANSVLTFGGSAPVPDMFVPKEPGGAQCSFNEATCRNGRCIPHAFRCDGKNDCGDNSDEACGPQDGSGTDVCQPNEIRCSDPNRGRKCVQKFWMCDGDRDCDDGSDEEPRYCDLLPRQRYCKTSEFQCTGANGTNGNPVCIPRSFQCDGYNDCPDRSDEVGCVKPTVISPPQRQIQINAGETLTIQCTARGSPAPYINWRLNWGHICGDGFDNGRCTIAQALDPNDPSLVTGTLTVRNTNANDAGAYSCEALNNQGFIFAIPDAIVNVIVETGDRPLPPQPCNCNGHSSYCSPDGRCQSCQHNTAGYNCESCATGYQGDARRGTPYDCQLIPSVPSGPIGNCDPSGTHMERGGRCICKYNVEGDRCNQCKRNHFYLNPTTPNGCLPCFCSGVSSDCTSSDWRRKALSLPLNNWNAVPKNFATDRYEARDRIQQRNGGREIALDQSSLGRPANEVLYWKAPKEALGDVFDDVVTLYDGNIDIHFTNDGKDDEAPSNDDFIWLRGNNIDLVHKLPQTQRFKANTDATYSVPCNERTFTRKDGTHIDRENILMALSDLDTLLIKINPIGGRRNAVLRGVTLNIAARDGYADASPTVEACRCPANYTGPSCEKCAEGYGRPHPLVGIYLGQCWSCRSLCHERSDQCNRETGKCSNCQGNSEGDRCERCHAGYVLDGRINQCVREDQYQPYPSQPSGETGTRGSYYINQRPYDSRGSTPFHIVLDGSLPEQRVPFQVLDGRPHSLIWSRTDGSSLPANVVQEGNDLVIRNPSPEQGGHYICTITHPDGSTELIPVHLDYRPGTGPVQPVQPIGGPPKITIQPRTINLKEGQRMIVQYSVTSHEPIEVVWNKRTDQGYQPIPSLFSVEPTRLVLHRATPDAAGTYQVIVRNSHGQDQQELNINVEPRRGRHRGQGAPQIRFQQDQYDVGYGENIVITPNISGASGSTITWSKDGSTNLPYGVTARGDGTLNIQGSSQDIDGQYNLDVTNAHGRVSSPISIRWRGAANNQQDYQVIANQYRRVQWNIRQLDLNEGHRLEAVCRTDADPSTLRLDVTRQNGQQREQMPLGLSFSNGYLSLSAVTNQDNGLEFICSSGDISDTLTLHVRSSRGSDQDRSRSYIDVRLQSRDEQSHQIGRDIHLQCAVHGSVERPYEYTFTKDGRSVENNVEVHPDGQLIIRNAQANDAGRYRCEVNFPRTPEVGTQESSYDLRIEGASAGGYDQNYQGGEQSHQNEAVEVTVEPTELTIGRGEKVTIKCHVKGAQQYKVTWGKYAHDTTLPDYARQEGNNVIIAPTNDSPAEQMYLQCQVDVPGHTRPHHAYAPVNVRGGDESSKKKKKRRS